jgi:hypothetical protein
MIGVNSIMQKVQVFTFVYVDLYGQSQWALGLLSTFFCDLVPDTH